MTIITIIDSGKCPINYNNGQRKEFNLRYTLTGVCAKADNVPCTVSGDCMDIQIKSARATICHGIDIDAYITADACKRYAYVAKNDVAYLMDKIEYAEFAKRFCTVTRESAKNGGAVKLRFKDETRAMMQWLTVRVS